MQDKRKIAEEITLVGDLRMLSEAFEEISVMKMQKVRSSVLRTRDFLTNLLDVFYDVKGSYKKQILELMKKKKKDTSNISSFSTLAKNGKEVIVLLSANTKLYGDIIPRVFNLFTEKVKSSNSDVVIVGKLGKDLFEQSDTKKAYKYFDVPDTVASFEDLKPLVLDILNYEKVTVFYGKFENVINQTPTSINISGEEPIDEEAPEEKRDFKFLFEPSLERILNFFETQMFTSFFKQTVDEFELARHASRIRAMEEALGNIDTKVKLLKSQQGRAKRLTANKKQIETISGISLWG